jgi:hypothetical protein
MRRAVHASRTRGADVRCTRDQRSHVENHGPQSDRQRSGRYEVGPPRRPWGALILRPEGDPTVRPRRSRTLTLDTPIVGMPIYRGCLIEPIEQEVDAVRLHALGDREVVDQITSL